MPGEKGWLGGWMDGWMHVFRPTTRIAARSQQPHSTSGVGVGQENGELYLIAVQAKQKNVGERRSSIYTQYSSSPVLSRLGDVPGENRTRRANIKLGPYLQARAMGSAASPWLSICMS